MPNRSNTNVSASNGDPDPLDPPAFDRVRPILLTTGIAGIVIVIAATMPLIDSRYGDGDLAAAIGEDNRQVCRSLGFNENSSSFADCTASLSALRRRHEALLSAYSLP